MRVLRLQGTRKALVDTLAAVQHHDAVGVGVGQRLCPVSRLAVQVFEHECINRCHGRLVQRAELTRCCVAAPDVRGGHQFAHVRE